MSALRRKRKHNFILETLMESQEITNLHKTQILKLIKSDLNLTKSIWEESWVDDVSSIVRELVGDDVEIDKVARFLTWPDEIIELPISNESSAMSNRFHYPNHENPDISIRLGSIHSVKGQNHTATLVLDTFLNGRNGKTCLDYMKSWILGDSTGKGKEGPENTKRLKLHYVAMTRPTHLLCLAMKYDSFTGNEIDNLKGRDRWNIKVL